MIFTIWGGKKKNAVGKAAEMQTAISKCPICLQNNESNEIGQLKKTIN